MILRILFISAVLLSAHLSLAQHPVEGTWEWQYSTTETGGIINPATEGYTRQLFFGSEPDRIFHEYRDEVIHLTGNWGLTYVWTDEACYEMLGAWGGSGEFFIESFDQFPDNDTMVLTGLVEEHFVRRGPVPNESGCWGDMKRAYR